MKSPFRKLIRISIVLFVVVILFNFFGYYLNHIKSIENKELVESISISGNQQTISQLITKNAFLLLDNPRNGSKKNAIKDSLSIELANFRTQQQILQKQIGSPALPAQAHLSAIKLLLSSADGYFQAITNIGEELVAADSATLHKNRQQFLRDLLHNDQQFQSVMNGITQHYTAMVDEKNSELSRIDVGKLVLLVIAIGCLIVLVLEPAFKKGENNYKELQKAKNELVSDKKYLSSILRSQTNYVIRLSRTGRFTYANTSFLDTFGYREDEIRDTLFNTTVFPKDLQRCRQVADECWNNPGKIYRLLIRKPVRNSTDFLWTEWEFLALTNENGLVDEIQGIGLDVTNRVQIQEVKEDAIQTLSYAMTYAKMGSWKLDLQSGEFLLSRELKALLALDEEDPARIPLDEFLQVYIVPEDFALVSQEFSKAMRNKESIGYETSFSCRIITKQGWMRYLSVKGKITDEQGSFGIAQDITSQKESENALLNSEQKFRLLAENSEDIISVHALDGTIWYLSPSVTTVLGYDVDEVIGRSIEQYVHPEDRQKFISAGQGPFYSKQNGEDSPGFADFGQGIAVEHMEDHGQDTFPNDPSLFESHPDYSVPDNKKKFNPEESIIVRYRILRKQGDYIWLETIIKPILDEDEVVKLICTSRNITEQNNAHEKLKKKDQLLQAVAQATHSLLINTDLDMAIAESIQSLGSRALVDRVYIFQNHFSETQQQWLTSETHEWTDDEYAYRLTNPNVNVKNIPFESIKKIIEPLQKRRPFLSYKSDERDPQLKAIYEKAELLSSVAVPIFVQDQFWGFVGFDAYKREREWSEGEFSILRSYASSLAAAIKRKQITEEMVQARKLAESASHAKSEFMANMSHELRTPMNGIIGFTDLVLTTELQKAQREYLQNVKKSAYGLLGIINDILDFSKIEAGKLLIDNTLFKLDELIEETIDILTVKAFEKKLEMLCRVDPSIPSQFLGDPVRIRQIVVNLLGNAIKFTSEGEIFVSIQKNSDTYVEDGKKYMRLDVQVKDSGIGIPREKLQKIFESFTQADTSTTRKYGGTGLGLTISKSLAELMGGYLSVESEPGNGSSFTLHLILEVANEQPEVLLPGKPLLKKVLIVDDNTTNLALMQETFGYFRIEAETARSGAEALLKIAEATRNNEPFNLILTDHQMPGMDGITLVKEIKKEWPDSEQPFILMLSSLEKNIYQHEAAKAGISKFLSKPVKIHELHATLLSLFEKTMHNDLLHPSLPSIEKITEPTSIMVADDDPINMLLISEVLRRLGFEVIQVSNGREALEKLPHCEPVMIFMDVNMPEMDGYTTTRHIRKLPQPHCNIPIIALTADAMKGDREKCLEAGMNNYISKPFRLEEIDEVLKNYTLLV
jgi:PAS domain S-box-containing protein